MTIYCNENQFTSLSLIGAHLPVLILIPVMNLVIFNYSTLWAVNMGFMLDSAIFSNNGGGRGLIQLDFWDLKFVHLSTAGKMISIPGDTQNSNPKVAKTNIQFVLYQTCRIAVT